MTEQLSITALLKLRKKANDELEEAQRFQKYIENQLANALVALAAKSGERVDFQVSTPPSVRLDEARGRIRAT